MLMRLPTEIIDIVMQHAISDSCPIACVCSFLKCRDATIRGFGRCRTLEVHGAFRSYSLLLHSLQDRRLARMCCLKKGKEVIWTALSTRAAFRSGSEDVIDNVNPAWKRMPESSISFVARYRRIDLFERLVNTKGSEMAAWMGTFIKSLAGCCESITSISAFIFRFMLPACAGGSIDMLSWVLREVEKRKLSNRCGWHTMFTNKLFTERMVHSAAACSGSSEKVLDFICDQMAMSSMYPIDTIEKHVASLVLLAIGAGSCPSAIQWASRRSASSFELLRSVREDVHNKLAVFNCTTPPYEHISMFCPRNVPVYRLVRHMVSEGGWMHKSIIRNVPEVQAVHWETLRALRKRTKVAALSHTDISLMEECCSDAVKEYICDGQGPVSRCELLTRTCAIHTTPAHNTHTAPVVVSRITKALRNLMEASVSSALCVAEHVMSLKAVSRQAIKRRDVLMNGPWSFAFEVVLRSTETRRADLVSLALGLPKLLDIESLEHYKVALLANAACRSNNVSIVESIFVSGVPYHHHHVERCIKMGWLRSTRTILKMTPYLKTPLAVQLSDQRAVEAEFDTGCIDTTKAKRRRRNLDFDSIKDPHPPASERFQY